MSFLAHKSLLVYLIIVGNVNAPYLSILLVIIGPVRSPQSSFDRPLVLFPFVLAVYLHVPSLPCVGSVPRPHYSNILHSISASTLEGDALILMLVNISKLASTILKDRGFPYLDSFITIRVRMISDSSSDAVR
jgi:hypothetical protein